MRPLQRQEATTRCTRRKCLGTRSTRQGLGGAARLPGTHNASQLVDCSRLQDALGLTHRLAALESPVHHCAKGKRGSGGTAGPARQHTPRDCKQFNCGNGGTAGLTLGKVRLPCRLAVCCHASGVRTPVSQHDASGPVACAERDCRRLDARQSLEHAAAVAACPPRRRHSGEPSRERRTRPVCRASQLQWEAAMAAAAGLSDRHKDEL